MAGDSSQHASSTRYLETTQGILTYSQLAPLLAERVLRVEQLIFEGTFESWPMGQLLVCELHAKIAKDLVPEWAGRWRSVEVRVGDHQPPRPYEVPSRMADFTADLQVRLSNLPEGLDSLLLETLAFAEGRLLSIHPFLDFNGRVTRLFLKELLHRLGLPPVPIVPATPEEEILYLAALRSGDSRNLIPLQEIWKRRFEHGFGRSA
jgi:CRISPR-associated endonuclease/helicase Cas3